MEGAAYLLFFGPIFLIQILPTILFYLLIFSAVFYFTRKQKQFRWANSLLSVILIALCIPSLLNLMLVPGYSSVLYEQQDLNRPLKRGGTILIKLDHNNEISADHQLCHSICQQLLYKGLYKNVIIESPQDETSKVYSIEVRKECEIPGAILKPFKDRLVNGECLVSRPRPTIMPDIKVEYEFTEGEKGFHNLTFYKKKFSVTNSYNEVLFMRTEIKASLFRTPLLIHPYNHKFHADKTYFLDPRLWFARKHTTVGDMSALISYMEHIFDKYQ